MTKLVNNVPARMSSGVKGVDMRMSSGSAKLQISVDGSTFTDIADSSKTANANFNITIPECKIQAVTTGDAEVVVNHIRM